MRTTIDDIMVSGYSFRVTAPRESIEGLAEELLAEIRATAMQNMQRAQDVVVAEVRRTLGREAARPARPNQPPRQITGELDRSWKRGRRSWRKRKTELRGAVESKHPAAAALEFGAFKSMGIRPHPYYRPALARVADEVGEIMVGLR